MAPAYLTGRITVFIKASHELRGSFQVVALTEALGLENILYTAGRPARISSHTARSLNDLFQKIRRDCCRGAW